MHSGDNKEASPYTAIKSNDVMDFLGNPSNYVGFKTEICYKAFPARSERKKHKNLGKLKGHWA